MISRQRRTAVLAVVATALLLGCGKGGKGGKGSGSASGRAGAPAFPVDVAPVKLQRLEYAVSASGRIEAYERVQVTSRVAGVVDKVLFSEGQVVAADSALVEIDAERFKLAANSARAEVSRAEAQAETARLLSARRDNANKTSPGLISQDEVLQFKTSSATAAAEAALAREALKVAELNLRDTSVRAPIAGIIQTRTVDTGQYVTPGYVMATLLRTEPLRLRFSVTPDEALAMHPGMGVTFKLRESTETRAAKVTLVSGAADDDTRMVKIVAEVGAPVAPTSTAKTASPPRPGTFCEVTIPVAEPADAVVVPKSAVRPSERGFIAYVIEDGVARERSVTLGMGTRDGFVEVRTGLAVGDRLVLRGAEPLTDGARVRDTEVATPLSSATQSGAAP
ncbi:MAG: efflux RND transporter periplasmic adaptor subunit [Polyangiaceae bacterium]